MPEIYELRIWAEGVVTDQDGNVVPQATQQDEDEKPEKPETEESQ